MTPAKAQCIDLCFQYKLKCTLRNNKYKCVYHLKTNSMLSKIYKDLKHKDFENIKKKLYLRHFKTKNSPVGNVTSNKCIAGNG